MISIIRLPLFNFNGGNNLPEEASPPILPLTSIPDTITRITMIKKIPVDNLESTISDDEIKLNSMKGEEIMSDEFNDEFIEELDNDDISELDGAEELTDEELEQLESNEDDGEEDDGEEDDGDLSKIIDDEELDDDEFPDIEEEDDFSGLDGE